MASGAIKSWFGLATNRHRLQPADEIERTAHALRMTVRDLKAERELKVA